MAKYGIVIDLTKCTGCAACTLACQAQNELEPGEVWVRVESTEEGRFPAVTRRFQTVQCNHCDNPPCAQVCPTKATYKRRDGIVLVDGKICIGCKYCVVTCPYQARVWNEERGTPGGCKLCVTRVTRGVQPACVLACPSKARTFGDLDDPESEISRLIVRKRPVRLRPDFGTGPNMYYVRGEK